MAKCLHCGEIVPDGFTYCATCEKEQSHMVLQDTMFSEQSEGLPRSEDKPFVLNSIGFDYKSEFNTEASFAESGIEAGKKNHMSNTGLIVVCAVLAGSVAALIITLAMNNNTRILAPSDTALLSESVTSQQPSSQSSAVNSSKSSANVPSAASAFEQSEVFEESSLSTEEQKILICLYNHYLSYLDAINEFEPSVVSYCTDLHRETCEYRIKNYNDENVFRFTSITADISTLRIYKQAGMTLAEVRTRVDYKYADRNAADRVWENGGNIQWFYFKKVDGEWLVNYAEQKKSERISSNTVTMK